MAYQFQPQGQFGQGYPRTVSTQSMLSQVLGITAIGMVIAGGAAWYFQGIPRGFGFIAMLVGFGLLFGINAARNNGTLSLALFYAFTFCEGVGIAPVIGYYVRAIGPGVVANAALTTGLGMFALGAIVYATGLDLRRYQSYFMIALLGLILVGIVSMFFRFIHPEVYSWLTLVIFSGLVLIDFARIRAGGDGLTPVQMATSIFLDAINIFLALLQIFGGRRSNN